MTSFSDTLTPRSKRILIVEDEPLIAYDLRTEIENGRHHVVGECGTASDAVKMAGELRPDLVVMDIGLSGQGTGIDAAREIRAQFDIGCIFVSATLDTVDPELWNDIQPVALIQKPYRDEALANAISRDSRVWEPMASKANATPSLLDRSRNASTPPEANRINAKNMAKNASNNTSN